MWLFFTSFIYIYKLCCFIFFSELLCWKNYTLTRTRIERRHAKFNDNLRDHDLPTASRILYTYGGLNKLFNIMRSSMFVYNIDKGRNTNNPPYLIIRTILPELVASKKSLYKHSLNIFHQKTYKNALNNPLNSYRHGYLLNI